MEGKNLPREKKFYTDLDAMKHTEHITTHILHQREKKKKKKAILFRM